ncbi:MAG: methionyl-tRNA formyltransferase, partial [Candidatus Limnocylindria bacterium]
MPQLGRIAFLGTGSFGVPLLSRLSVLADELLVISQPDRPAGRGLQTRPSPVAAWAREHGVRVATPRRLRSDEGRELLGSYAPEGLLLAAYGQLVPADLLEIAARPPLNVHPSLLPRHRGPDPTYWAIDSGDEETGVTVHRLEEAYDTGEILAQER